MHLTCAICHELLELPPDFFNLHQAEGGFEFVSAFEEHEKYGTRRREREAEFARLAADTTAPWAGRVKYVNIARYFEKVVHGRRVLQPVEPTHGGVLGYRDPDHLNEAGSMRLKTVVRREVFAGTWSHEVVSDFCPEYAL